MLRAGHIVVLLFLCLVTPRAQASLASHGVGDEETPGVTPGKEQGTGFGPSISDEVDAEDKDEKQSQVDRLDRKVSRLRDMVDDLNDPTADLNGTRDQDQRQKAIAYLKKKQEEAFKLFDTLNNTGNDKQKEKVAELGQLLLDVKKDVDKLTDPKTSDVDKGLAEMILGGPASALKPSPPARNAFIDFFSPPTDAKPVTDNGDKGADKGDKGDKDSHSVLDGLKNSIVDPISNAWDAIKKGLAGTVSHGPPPAEDSPDFVGPPSRLASDAAKRDDEGWFSGAPSTPSAPPTVPQPTAPPSRTLSDYISSPSTTFGELLNQVATAPGRALDALAGAQPSLPPERSIPPVLPPVPATNELGTTSPSTPATTPPVAVQPPVTEPPARVVTADTGSAPSSPAQAPSHRLSPTIDAPVENNFLDETPNVIAKSSKPASSFQGGPGLGRFNAGAGAGFASTGSSFVPVYSLDTGIYPSTTDLPGTALSNSQSFFAPSNGAANMKISSYSPAPLTQALSTVLSEKTTDPNGANPTLGVIASARDYVSPQERSVVEAGLSNARPVLSDTSLRAAGQNLLYAPIVQGPQEAAVSYVSDTSSPSVFTLATTNVTELASSQLRKTAAVIEPYSAPAVARAKAEVGEDDDDDYVPPARKLSPSLGAVALAPSAVVEEIPETKKGPDEQISITGPKKEITVASFGTEAKPSDTTQTEKPVLQQAKAEAESEEAYKSPLLDKLRDAFGLKKSPQRQPASDITVKASKPAQLGNPVADNI